MNFFYYSNNSIVRIMRYSALSIILLITTFQLCFSYDIVAQEILQRKVNLSMQNETLRNAIKQINRQTRADFVYSSKSDLRKIYISVKVQDRELESVLNEILPHNLTYEVVGNKIVIKNTISGHETGNIISKSTEPFNELINASKDVVVKGQVTDAKGEPLIGVSVKVKGTNAGASTDINGQYSLTLPDGNGILVFTYIGFVMQEVAVNNRQTVNVVLIADVSSLEEVVVVGYGTQKRSDLTGSVSSVRGDQLSAQAIRNPVQALTGLAPGVQVLQNSGEPGSALSVRVRGGNSLLGGNEPMYVIDGFPITGTLDNINPNDILSIEVLKDASATAIYGSRGANGVVIVTTKKGKTGRTLVQYNTYYGFQEVAKKIAMLNAQEFATIANVRAANDNISPYFTAAEIQSIGNGTDWQDEIFETAPIQNHSLSVSGGNDKTRFNLSGSYFDEKGIIINSFYNQAQFRANLEHDINKNWNVSFNNIVARSKSNFLFSNNTERGAGVLSGALISPPTVPVYDSNGNYSNVRKYSFSPDIAENPVAMALERKNNPTRNSLLTNLFIEGKMTPDLVFRTSVGIQYANSRTDFYSPTIFQPTATGSASITYGESMNIVSENTLTYTKTVNDDHHFTLLGGITSEKNKSLGVSAGSTGFLTNTLENNSLQSGTSPGIPFSSNNEYVLLSGLGRLNYSYKGKYLITSSIRADGSSRFGKSNRWGYFPSTAVAWRVSEEDFWQSIKPVLNDAKLRGSWGKTGNTGVSPYQSLSILSSVPMVLDDNLNIGFAPGSIKPNPELKWETTTQFDAGIDISLLNSKLQLTFDYYSKKTNDLLSSVPVSSSTGYTTTIKNLGNVQNNGIEAAINAYIFQERAFKWDMGINFSMNRNKVISLSGGTDIFGQSLGNTLPAMSLVREGYPIGVFYGYLENGLNEQGAIRYKDLDNNGIINSLDRMIIGDPNPDYIIGLNSHINYKNFDITILLTSIYGVDGLNYNLSNVADGFSFGINQVKDILGNYWTSQNPNPNAKYPKISKNTRYLGSDRFIEDASYIRVKNILLSYTLKKDIGVSAGSQVYVAVQNPFTFTNYSFYTPEVNTRGAGISRGIDQFGYPDAQTVMLGFRVKF